MTDIQVTVVTLYPGHAAEEVEKQVTIPVEIAVSGIPHSVRLFSHTQFGLSSTYITFDDEVDNYFARQQVIERLQSVDLPEGIHPELAPLVQPDWRDIPRLLEIRQVQLDGSAGHRGLGCRTESEACARRRRRGFSRRIDQAVPGDPRTDADEVLCGVFQQVFEALERSNMNAGGGYIEQGEQQFIIRGVGLLRTAEDIRKCSCGAPGRSSADRGHRRCRIGAQQRQGMVGMDAKDDIVNGTILMRKGENPSVVLDGVKAKIAELNSSILPKGVELVPYYDRAWLIDSTLKTVFKNLAEGALLVCLVLFFFLGRIAARCDRCRSSFPYRFWPHSSD